MNNYLKAVIAAGLLASVLEAPLAVADPVPIFRYKLHVGVNILPSGAPSLSYPPALGTLVAGTAVTPLVGTPSVSGLVAPITYTISAGSLPGGLALDTVAGIISGTPSAGGTFNYTVRATDSTNATVSTAIASTVTVTPRCAIAGGTITGCTTITSTWTPPAGVMTVRVLVVGGGGEGQNGGPVAPGAGSGYVTVNNAYGVTPSNPVTITVGAGGAATAIAAGYECYWNIKSGGGTSSFGAVTAAGAVGIGTTTFPGNGGNGGSGGGGYGGPVYGYASGSNTGGTAGGAGVSQGGSGGTGQGSFPSFSAFTINTVTAGAGGAGGITTDWGSGGGGGGVVVTGSNYPHGSTAGGEAWTGNWVAGGSDGVGFGGGGAGGWGGDSLPPGMACYAGDVGAAGVVYIEW